MDISINSNKGVTINVAHDSPNIDIGRPVSVGIDIAPSQTTIRPKKSGSPVFEFVQKVVAGANVVRCTLAEFEAIANYDGRTWYAVTTTTDELRYLYLGGTLIAQASQDGGTWGFTYTFPMTFGR